MSEPKVNGIIELRFPANEAESCDFVVKLTIDEAKSLLADLKAILEGNIQYINIPSFPVDWEKTSDPYPQYPYVTWCSAPITDEDHTGTAQ